ncbi:MAG TPA: hypothetical protein VFK43_03340 [Acidimicrobiales bacterium]|nr:hypothetical protein [Acidimicrobiales bacterium]
MTTASEIVVVLVELGSLRRRDPDALRRREEILATKAELVALIRADQGLSAADQP